MQSIYKALKFNFGKTLLAAVLLLAGTQTGYGQCTPPSVVLPDNSPVTLCDGAEWTLTPTINSQSAGSASLIYTNNMAGPAINCNCPEGYAAVGYQGEVNNGYIGQWSLACKKLNRDGTLDSNVVFTQRSGSAGGFNVAPVIAVGNSALTSIDGYVSGNLIEVQGTVTPIASIVLGHNNFSGYLNPVGGGSAWYPSTSSAPPGCVITGISTFQTFYASGFRVIYKPVSYFTGSFLWSTGDTTSAITTTQPGAYSVTYTNNFDCSATSNTISVLVGSAPVATISASGDICNFGSVTLSSNPAEHYLWSNGQTSQSVTVNRSGNYQLIITNAEGCSDSSEIFALGRMTPAAPVAGVTGITCNGNATLTATGLAPGGQVLDFGNTVNDNRYVEVVQDLPEHNFTIEMWVKTTSANCGIFCVKKASSVDHDRHLYLNNGQLWCRVWNAPEWNSGVTINDGQWHHVALTVADGVGQRIYVDGILAPGYSNHDYSVFDWQNTFRLGFSDDAGEKYFKGTMDNVRIWSRSLDVTEIRSNMSRETAANSNGLIYHATLNGTLNAATGPNGTGNGNLTYANADFYTYTWTGAGAPSPSTSESQVTGALAANGVYSVVASAGSCNSQPATVNVTLPAVAIIATANKTAVCSYDNVTLTATGNAVNYTWSNGVQNGVAFMPSSTATYTVTGVTGDGCSATATVSVVVMQPVSSTITTAICEGTNYAGHTTAGTYTDTYTTVSGCDSIRTLILSIIPTSSSTVTATICQGDTYEGYTTTGTYTDHFTNTSGCDSARTLVLSVTPVTSSIISATICAGGNYEGYITAGTYTDHFTNAGGCDSTRTLVLSVTPVTSSTISATICEGDAYEGYSTAGTYTDHFTNAGGCDSARTLVLSVTPVVTSAISATICQGDNYAGYTTTGTYTDHYTSATGCDSARTLVLSVTPVVTSIISVTICQGESYAGHTTAGIYTDHYTSATGCDSARTLDLSVIPGISSFIATTICEGESFEGYNTAGNYIDHYTSVTGCDSIRKVELTVIPVTYTTISATICNGDNYQGYTATGTYSDHYRSAAGCDSVRTLELTVLPGVSSTISTTICEGGIYEGYMATGIYTNHYTSATGCDSTRTLELTVLSPVTSTISATICEGGNYEGYMFTGTYTDYFTSNSGCDSTRILELTVLPGITTTVEVNICAGSSYEGYTQSGFYIDHFTSSTGCDSTRRLFLNYYYISSDITVAICQGESYAGHTTQGFFTDHYTTEGGCDSTRYLTLIVRSAPQIMCPSVAPRIAAPNLCGAIVNFAANTLGQPSVLSYSHAPGSLFNLGTTNVTVTATLLGCSATCTFPVVVNDIFPPTILCADTKTVPAEANCEVYLQLAPPLTHDNCGIASLVNTFNNTADASGTYPAGTTAVYWTAYDMQGLSATCLQWVKVYPCVQLATSATNTVCTGTANGTATAIATNEVGGFAYLWSNGETTATIFNLAPGSYNVTVTDQAGSSATASVSIGTTIPTVKPATPGAISGPVYPCKNQSNTYSVAAVPLAASYTWTVPANVAILSGQGTSQITVQPSTAFTGGTLSVQAANCVGISAKSSLTLRLLAVPARPASITGVTSVCGAKWETYTAATVANATSYTWTMPLNAVIMWGQGSNTIMVAYQPGYVSGSISVTADNCVGSSVARTLLVNPAPVPSTPSVITGPASVCPNNFYQYQVTLAANVDFYNWQVPANAMIVDGYGRNSILVMIFSGYTGGVISVSGTNCSGSGAVRNLTVNPAPVPSTPSVITGTAVVCPGQIGQYQVTQAANVLNYTWGVPANATIISGDGTNAITVEFQQGYTGGAITVFGTNCSGNGAVRNLTVNRAPVPSTPSVITGTAAICPGQTYQYQVTQAANVVNYTWVVPANATIISGEGTNAITVEFQQGYTGGAITVFGTNCSGNGLIRSMNVNALGLPARPSIITGTAAVCPEQTYQYSILPVANALSYTWTMPAGAYLQSGDGTTGVEVYYSSAYMGGSLSVYATGCSGNGLVRTLAVTKVPVPARPGAVTGTAKVCVGLTYSYQIPALANATSYTWILPANVTLVSGQGTTNLTVSYDAVFTTGTISVYATGCSGNGLVRDLAVTKLAIPAKPGAITGTAAVCQNGTYQYEITAVTNTASYTWTVPATATIQSGQGTNIITLSYSGTFIGGPITVYASNCSGNGVVQTKTITKTTTGCVSAKTDETEDDNQPETIIEEEQPANEFNVQLYPNPFKSQFSIRLNGVSDEPLSISIYNISGQLLEEMKTQATGTDVTVQSALPAGVYMIKVSQGGQSKVIRLVKAE